jgi:NADH-quinone oxidoreductase subunit F
VEHGGASQHDLDLILEVAGNIMGNTICPLGDAAAMMIAPYVKKFRDEWVAHIENGGCPFPEYALA